MVGRGWLEGGGDDGTDIREAASHLLSCLLKKKLLHSSSSLFFFFSLLLAVLPEMSHRICFTVFICSGAKQMCKTWTRLPTDVWGERLKDARWYQQAAGRSRWRPPASIHISPSVRDSADLLLFRNNWVFPSPQGITEFLPLLQEPRCRINTQHFVKAAEIWLHVSHSHSCTS